MDTGKTDATQATIRYIGVLVGATVAVLGFVKAHDLAGAALYVQNNLGDVVAALSGLVAIGTAAYGVIKSHTRGKQLDDLS